MAPTNRYYDGAKILIIKYWIEIQNPTFKFVGENLKTGYISSFDELTDGIKNT